MHPTGMHSCFNFTISILCPDDNDLINVEMHMKMQETNIQNVVYPCCGFFEVKKYNIEHNRCYGSDIEAKII